MEKRAVYYPYCQMETGSAAKGRSYKQRVERGPQASQTMERGSGKIIMKTSDFYYDLPQELIAQDPLEDRSSSRLMHLSLKDGSIEHRHFTDILDYLHKGDCLVINDTKVIPARLYGHKEETGALIEILLLKRRENDIWECLVKPGKKARPGQITLAMAF